MDTATLNKIKTGLKTRLTELLTEHKIPTITHPEVSEEVLFDLYREAEKTLEESGI